VKRMSFFILTIITAISGCSSSGGSTLQTTPGSTLVTPKTISTPVKTTTPLSTPIITSTPSINTVPNPPNDAFNKLSETEKKMLQQGSPKDIITLYYQAILARNYNLAFALVSRIYSIEEENQIKKFWGGITSLKNLQIKLLEKFADGHVMPQTDTDVLYEVQYDVVINPKSGSAEETGRSLYFVGLHRNTSSDRWEITVLGTGP
jgi:hypothetical protein